MTSDGPPLLRPRPRRPFEIGPLSSTNTSSQPSPEPSATAPPPDESPAPPSRSRSILNLTSSTLAGVFGYNSPDRDGTQTPWGTGAETPIDGLRQELGELLSSDNNGGKSLNMDEALEMRCRERRGSMLDQSTSRRKPGVKKSAKKKGLKSYWLPVVAKTAALGTVGVVYGGVISHLHDRQKLAPVQVDGIKHDSPYYLAFWGVVGIALGWLMPYVDGIWHGDDDEEEAQRADYKSSRHVKRAQDNTRGGWAPVWNDLVRTMGAFCGLAFAIRRVPWHSTLQLSLTLALSNPTLWYLLDRSAPGFILSTTVALSGTALLLGINPDLVPSPSSPHIAANNSTLSKGHVQSPADFLVAGIWSHESVAVATWIASVLFVSCVCFGNIGRRL